MAGRLGREQRGVRWVEIEGGSEGGESGDGGAEGGNNLKLCYLIDVYGTK